MKILVGRPSSRFFISIEVLFLAFLTLFVVTGCLNEGSGSEDATQVVADPDDPVEVLPPLTTPERTVCDPFDSGVSAQDRGLVGNLLYLTDDQPRYDNVEDYMTHGTPIPSTLYFDRLYVPTRAFDLGFYTQAGQIVLNQNDEAIYEYFALRLESQLMLAANESPGWYQLAVLADDGAILEEKLQDNSTKLLIDSDGNSPTRMGCSVKSIYMDGNTKRHIILKYFQGPRYHIALTMLWRPLPSGEDPDAPVDDIECGRFGNSRYFDSTQTPSQPQIKFYELLERGWKPLTNENYFFPAQATNPCAVEDPLLLTNFNLDSYKRTEAIVSWTTSLPATSQIELKNISSGLIQYSTLETSLNTSHRVTFTGLTANTLYSVKGISESSDGQIVESAESAFRTPR